jgi:hypothetical protein
VVLCGAVSLLCGCTQIVAGDPQVPIDVTAIAPFPPIASGHELAGEQYRLIRERGVAGSDRSILADMVLVCVAPTVYLEMQTASQRARVLMGPGTSSRSFYEARVLVAAAWAYVCPEQARR